MGNPSNADLMPGKIADALRTLAAEWVGAKAGERANYQLYIGGLCSAIGVEGPRPAGSGYDYELPVKVVDRDGKESSNFLDLFKRDRGADELESQCRAHLTGLSSWVTDSYPRPTRGEHSWERIRSTLR